ncbi:nuclear transport factor 2 family protein [Methyloversatilis thermotolerans]|uniref:nuclear transport factor 2 family protein n=1 Tax=Methyloversatilis thermotolerans TaxID=1346290 RepID=UPI0038CC018B
MLCVLPVPALADDFQDAEQLFRQKQAQPALEKIESFLAQKPRDPQGRFFKGLILTELGRIQEATLVFQKLTEDYPELPEPYNNLAVLYAQQKQFEKARTALEMAIRTHPSYAVAHENLGDIYARMATQAYDRALQLDSSNAGAQSKLNLIRELVSRGKPGSPSPGAVAAKPAENARLAAKAPDAVKATEAARPAPPVPPPPAPAPAPQPPARAADPAKAPAPAASTPPPPPAVPAKAVAPASAPAAAPVRPGPADTPASTELSGTVRDWAAAWARKDVKSYLGFYAPDFKVPDGKSRAAWEAERRSRIDKPGAIEVRVENIQVRNAAGERADVTFRQHYKAVGLKTSTTKTLSLVRRNNRWLIQQERVGG